MGYGRENFEANMAKDVRGAAMGEGEEELFEKKLSKAEKKAAAKAAREAKRKKKGLDKKSKKADKEEEDDSEKKLSPEEAQKRIDAILNDPTATKEQKQEAALENLSNEEIVVTYESRKAKMHANARNINVSGVTVTFHGKPLIEETDLVINYGNRYGFIGPNGSGKVSHWKCMKLVIGFGNYSTLSSSFYFFSDLCRTHHFVRFTLFLSEYCHEGDCRTGHPHPRQPRHLFLECRVSRPRRHYGARGRHGIE